VLQVVPVGVEGQRQWDRPGRMEAAMPFASKNALVSLQELRPESATNDVALLMELAIRGFVLVEQNYLLTTADYDQA
jgi:hypothetical protein